MIADKIGAALQRIVDDGLTPRAVYLDGPDYQELHEIDSAEWGSCVWPLSVAGIPIVNEKLADQITIPVRPRTGVVRRRSEAIANNGCPYAIHLP